MISVCMATRNGEAYLPAQLASILPQLSKSDEVIISDDRSEDSTRTIIENYRDPRLKLVSSPHRGVVANFENALQYANGHFIFLADQDDVWQPDKIGIMMKHLKNRSLVVCDCAVTNAVLQTIIPSYFAWNRSRPGVIKNLLRNSYMGCCLAFQRKILARALPFPKGIPVHDQWLGLVAETFYDVEFIDQPLVLHRRHERNASSTASRSRLRWPEKIKYRFQLASSILQMKYA